MDFWATLLGIKAPVIEPKPEPTPVVEPEPTPIVEPEPIVEPKPEPKPKAVKKAKAKAEPKVEKPDFTNMSKAQLVDYAKIVGVELNMKMKRDEMVSTLNA